MSKQCKYPRADELLNKVWTTNELKQRYGVDFYRVPHGETMRFENAVYLGHPTILNRLFNTTYQAHLWIVDFLRANGKAFAQPIKGILEISVSRWASSTMTVPEMAFEGRWELEADTSRRIVSSSKLDETTSTQD